jgi:hypothetical protein
MLKAVLNQNSLHACCADCPADNQACQLALFLYETLPASLRTIGTQKIITEYSLTKRIVNARILSIHIF